MSKFILAITLSTLRTSEKGITLDSSIDFSAGRFYENPTFDTAEQALNAWKVRRAHLKELHSQNGWNLRPDEEDDEEMTVRTRRLKGGCVTELLYCAAIVQVAA